MLRLLIAMVLAFAACDTPREPRAGDPGASCPLNINRATVKELEALPAIGPKRARSIIASRNARGGQFTTLDDLLAIEGIGEHTLDAVRGCLVLGPPR